MRRAWSIVTLLAATCRSDVAPPDKLESTSTPSTDATSADSTASTLPEDTGTTDTPLGCTNPAFTCESPPACPSEESCGPLRPFDEAGCLRRSCTFHADCGDTERCFLPFRHDECDTVATTACADVDGACTCTVSSDLPAYCVAADDVPGSETPCYTSCGTPGTRSRFSEEGCVCDRGFVWCHPDDPDDYTCCEPTD
jgi:hypothetical protein